MSVSQTSGDGTVLCPNYHEGPAEIVGDVHLHQRFFTYKCDAGLVAGKTFNVMFTIDRSARVVWPYLKDLNCWQNAYGQYYSGVVGDLEGKTFRVSKSLNETGPHQYRVLRVIPEHLIVVSRPVSIEDQRAGIQPDFYVFILDEHDNRTLITVLTGRASLSSADTEEAALAPWREMAKESHHKFRDAFIPDLKRLIYDGNS